MEHDNSFFSIIVPMFNSEKYIVETLNSVINQIFKNYEVIIIDDLSSDKSISVVEKFIKNRTQFKLYCNELNIGVANTRNRAIRLAKGDYIAFLDSDDIWEKNKLLLQYNLVMKTDIDVCYTDYSFIDENSKKCTNYKYKTKQRVCYKSLLKENYIGLSTAIVKRKIAEEHLMNSDYSHEDYVFWLEIFKKNYTGYGINESLVKYRISNGSRSSNKILAARNRLDVYKSHEELGITSSIYYFIFYAFNSLRKHINIKRWKQ